MKDIRQQQKREREFYRQEELRRRKAKADDARQCKQCGKWFTVKKRNDDRTLCFRCEEGQATD